MIQQTYRVSPKVDLEATFTAIDCAFPKGQRIELSRGGGRPTKGEPTETQIHLKLEYCSVLVNPTTLQIYGEPSTVRKVFESLRFLIKSTRKNESIHYDLAKMIVYTKEIPDATLGAHAVRKSVHTYSFESLSLRSYKVSQTGRLRGHLSFEVLDEAGRSTEEKISQLIAKSSTTGKPRRNRFDKPKKSKA